MRALRRPRATASLAVLVAGTLLAACGGDGGEDAAPTTTTPDAAETTVTSAVAGDDASTTTAQPGDTTTASTGTEETISPDEGIAAIESLAQDLLITLDELGIPGFADFGYAPGEGPGPCGVDLDAEVPPDVVVGTQLGSDELQARFRQELRVYLDPDDAAAAFDAISGAFACGTDTDGTTFEGPADVTAQVGGDQASAWDIAGDGFEGVVVVVRLVDTVGVYLFVAAPGSEDLPAPLDVAAFGTGKILALIESNG